MIVLGLCLGLILVEVFLRLVGFGYYSVYRIPEDAAADYRIFCIGESTTWGVGASNPILKGYPRQLEEMLREKFPHKNIQCFFDETIGQNTSEILEKMPTYIKKHQPNLMIFMVGANNWWNLDKSNILLFSKNKFISETYFKILVFLDRFRVWKLFKWIAYSLGLKKERWNYGWPSEWKVDEMGKIIRNRYDWSIFMKIAEYDIMEMMKICQLNNIKAIICSYPGEGGDLYYVHKSIAQKFRVPFVDNFKLFMSLPRREEYFAKDVPYGHPNDEGYRLVAENIFKCILENKLIE